MIRDVLVPALQARFRTRGIKTGTPPGPIAVFPAANPAVGDISIFDEGNEAKLQIGTLTHQHFNPYNTSLSQSERAKIITEEMVEFLRRLFADRVLILRGRGTAWSNVRVLDDDDELPAIPPNTEGFLWSGPVGSA
jgi:hypothetical protein